MELKSKNVLLGITGSIAAYKSADLIQLLKEEGAVVRVIMTASSKKLVSPTVLATLSGNRIYSDAWEEQDSAEIIHIELARWADILLIAPCTAHTLAELANGTTHSLISLIYLAYDKKAIVAPAMNTIMYQAASTQRNIRWLQEKGDIILPTEVGSLACGEYGEGKFLSPSSLIEYVKSDLAQTRPYAKLSDKNCLIVMGHTEEKIDEVRFIANRSSGKTGIAIARALQLNGAKVTLICGKLNIPIPEDFNDQIHLSNTEEILKSVKLLIGHQDLIIMSAALADFVPLQAKVGKIKNSKSLKKLDLKESPHILKQISNSKKPGQIIVGFALENKGNENLGKKKLKDYGCDLLVLNTPLSNSVRSGFGMNNVHGIVIGQKDRIPKKLPHISKYSLADKLLSQVDSLF